MEHGNQFQPFTSNPVRNYVGGIRYDKLTRSGHAAGPANLRVGSKKCDGFKNPARDQRGVPFGVLFDVLSQPNEVAYRPAGPDDIHLGALVSPGFPQDLSHSDTFAWATSIPDSSSAMPA